jgi:uncharacterized protein (TIGR03437 family)
MGGRVLSVLLTAALAIAQSSNAPYYSAASIANSAASIAGYYAPNSFVTIYGTNLAYSTVSMTGQDISGGILPTALPGAGVRVLINNIFADLWYVSPGQINILVPNYLAAGPAIIQMEVDGLAGPAVQITLLPLAPAMFQLDASTVLGVHLDGSKITAASPASSGEVIVLFATGLGTTIPQPEPNQIPRSIAILATPGFGVWINGTPVDPVRILYAGVVPGYAGLYQVNLRLPDGSPPNPELRIGWTSQMSPAQLYLPLQ